MNAEISTNNELQLVKQALLEATEEVIKGNNQIVVSCQEDAEKYGGVLKTIKELNKKIEDKRKSFVEPLNKVVANINADFKPMSERLKRIEADIKNKILAYVQEEERKVNEEKKRREEEARKKEAERLAEIENLKKLEQKATNPLVAEAIKEKIEEAESNVAEIVTYKKPVTAVNSVGGGKVFTKKVWTFELVDLSKVPLEYLMIDTVKINNAIREGVIEIAGLHIFQKNIMASNR